MKKLFKPLLSDTILFWGFLLSCILFVVSVALIGIFYTKLPPYLPLFNQLPWGYARVGSRLEFFIPLGIAFVSIIGNAFLCSILHPRVILLARFLATTTLAVCLSAMIFTAQILIVIH